MQPRAYALHYVLAFAYHGAGRKAAAIRELEIAHRLNPRDELVSKALRELQNSL
jgi:hypothetical protein